jgi:TRAP-type C4-dicarboxylate transport system permease large subunit
VTASGLDAASSGPVTLMGFPAEPVTLALMLAVFLALAIWQKWPIGIALVLAAWAGAAVNGTYLPARHLIEGAFSYLDPILVIATAMIFMRVLADGGALAAAGAAIERTFSRRPAALLPLVMLMVMFPGMITGSSTASVLTTGAMAAPLLIGLGLPPARAAALIAMGGVLGMVAPPINIPAMLIGGGIDLPYVGFDGPLALAAFPVALVVCYGLGWPLLRTRGRTAPQPVAKPVAAASAIRPLALWRVIVPVLAGAVLMIAPRVWPASVPDPGLPLTFLLAAGSGIAVLPRFPIGASAERAMREALPVLGILTGVGGFIQVMTLTGGRGWIVSVMLGAPPWAVLAAAAVSMPLFGAVSAFGSASVLGVPFLLAMLGRDEVVTTSALSLLAGLGDLMLPAAVAATLAAQVAGVADRRHVLKLCIIPALASIAVAALMLVYSPEIGRALR